MESFKEKALRMRVRADEKGGGEKEESGGRGQKRGRERNLQQSLSSFLTSFFKV